MSDQTASNITWPFRRFASTVTLARLDKALHAELQRRAEYAIRFGIHAPNDFDFRAALFPLIVAFIFGSIYWLI